MFLEKLEKREGHRKAVLLMHTDPFDSEGPNLLALREKYGMEENVIFSTERVGFEQLNEYYNATDFTINISHSEGFGLSTLESMMTGTPIIAPMTGGQSRQVQDYRDNTHNGIALPIEFQTMVGNQQIPYILEDYTSVETISEAMLEMYQIKKLPNGYSELCNKVKEYADYEFNYENRVNQWDNLIEHTIQSWKTRYNRYKMEAM
jgi:glycosyltransferase involved in cell wall biosynthesis